LIASIRNGLFVSDLHLFSPRSSGQQIVTEIAQRSHQYECIVLGGDIFDFRWSTQGSHGATLQAASEWLLRLLATTRVPLLYLPGNHDCHPDFLNDLQALHVREPRLLWAEHHLQIADCLFLHGDVLDAGSLQGLAAYRQKFHHTEPQSELTHRLYDAAVGMRIHKIVPALRHSPMRTCQRLLRLIESLPLEGSTPVRKVYFGHTHLAIHGLKVDETLFYNPGAALKHMRVHIHEFQVAE
jgi:UDP-2,3-diacylglucosamine pyrophosphatase LpxH